MTDDTAPELDPVRRKALQDGHYSAQVFRWDRAGRKLTERKRAEVLAELELSELWEEMTDSEREKALKDVAEDRHWPGLFDRKAAESAEADREAQQLQQAAREQLEKTGAAITAHAQEMAERRAKEDREHQKAAKAEEAASRKAREAERERLREERDKLVKERDKLVKK